MAISASRIPWLVLALAFQAAVGVGCSSSSDAPAVAVPDRVVLVVADTLRRDHLSVYGSTLTTPSIERLAREGQVFQRAVSSFHQTTMSMAALFTGLTPSIEGEGEGEALPWSARTWCGMSRFAEDSPQCVPTGLTTLGEDLRSAGYHTIGVVANQLLFRPYGFDQGFDIWGEVGHRPETLGSVTRREAALARTASAVNRAALEAVDRRPSDRFFLYLHYIDVHDWAVLGRDYAEGVEGLDAALGRLLDGLEQRGLLEDAVVIFASDHGEMLVREHLGFDVRTHFGNPSFEPLLLMPLIVRPPVFPNVDAAVRSEDLRDMMRGLVGLGPASTVQRALEPGELYLSELAYQTYRSGRWKSSWQRDTDRVLLFDLEQDPGEANNVAEQYPQIMARHRQRIDELSEELKTRGRVDSGLSPQDLDRLRALGYVD